MATDFHTVPAPPKAIPPLAAIGLAALLAVSWGCATKKHVRSRIEPLDHRIGSLEQTSKTQQQSMEELQIGVSRADERARSALDKAGEAARAAAEAGAGAATAQAAAGDAARQAESAASEARLAQEHARRNEMRLDAIDQFEVLETRRLLFTSGSSNLTEQARMEIDDVVVNLNGRPRYVFELEGYADRTGPRTVNQELSRRRAAAVLRYLVTEHKVPLRRIHVAGLGSETPAADNSTRAGRAQNRRVELRLLAPKAAAQGAVLESKTMPSPAH